MMFLCFIDHHYSGVANGSLISCNVTLIEMHCVVFHMKAMRVALI